MDGPRRRRRCAAGSVRVRPPRDRARPLPGSLHTREACRLARRLQRRRDARRTQARSRDRPTAGSWSASAPPNAPARAHRPRSTTPNANDTASPPTQNATRSSPAPKAARTTLGISRQPPRDAAAAARLDTVADARARWLLHHAETLTAGDTAGIECFYRRGLGPGLEADRTTADELFRYREWMDADARARAEDDAHRTIAEADLHDAGHYGADDSKDVVRGAAHGITESERQQILQAATARGLEVDIQAPVVSEDDIHAAADADVTATAADRGRPRIAAVLADLDRLGSPSAVTERSDAESVVDAREPVKVHDADVRSARALTADAAAAEIEAAAAAAARAAERLADETSQNTAAGADTAAARQELLDNDSWEARRAAQINAENDAVADAGRWHDEAANYSDHSSVGAGQGEYVDRTQQVTSQRCRMGWPERHGRPVPANVGGDRLSPSRSLHGEAELIPRRRASDQGRRQRRPPERTTQTERELQTVGDAT